MFASDLKSRPKLGARMKINQVGVHPCNLDNIALGFSTAGVGRRLPQRAYHPNMRVFGLGKSFLLDFCRAINGKRIPIATTSARTLPHGRLLQTVLLVFIICCLLLTSREGLTLESEVVHHALHSDKLTSDRAINSGQL